MDDALAQFHDFCDKHEISVLILVVMDDALAPTSLRNTKPSSCLNPCCNG